MKKLCISTFIVGIIVLLISFAMMPINPSKAGTLPEGFFSPIIAFEFIKTNAEVTELFNVPNQSELLSKFNLGLKIDFVYMIAYSLLLALVLMIIYKKTGGKKFYLFMIILPFIIMFGDFFENLQLLTITSNLQSGDFQDSLALLPFITWIKWGGLTVYFSILSFFFLKSKKAFGKIYSVTAALTLLLAIISIFTRSMANEIFVLSIGLLFILVIAFSWLERNEI